MLAGLNELMRLRAALPEDAAHLRAVYASTREEELSQVPWSAEQKAAFCSMQFDAQDSYYREHYPTASYQVIESQGELAGRLYVDHWEREIRIMDIALLPRFRRLGIGSLILTQLQNVARAAAKTLSIHVEKFNPALRLYERLGFSLKEDKGVYLLMEWTA